MSSKPVALVAHDNKKKDFIEWVKFKHESMRKCEIYGTGTMGKPLDKEPDFECKTASRWII